MLSRRDEFRQLLVLAVLCIFLFFFGLANFGLVGADEPRYAQIGREMFTRSDWVTPRLHGEVWLEKPVLYYWLEMVSYKLFGVSDWAARLPAAVLGAILIAAIYFFARRFRAGSQMEAAMITASSVAIFGFARGVSTDMPLAVFCVLALLAWWAFFETQQRIWLVGFYVSLALATLAKGPIALVLAGLVLGAFAALLRDFKILLRTLWLPGIAVFCAVALPWYVLVQLRNPQFFSEFILRHNLARFSTDLFRHSRPFWYFVPVLLVGLLPWTTLSVAGAVKAFRTWRIERQPYSLFLLLWGVIPVIFFSLSESKLPGYILPAIPAWTLLAADYLHTSLREQKKNPGALIATHGLASAIVVAAVVLAPRFMLERHPHFGLSLLLGVLAVAAATFLFVAGIILWRGTGMVRFVTLIPLLVSVAYVVRLAAPLIDLTQSARPVAKNIEQVNSPMAAFKVPRALEYGLGFYRDQRIARYERGEVPEQGHFLLAAEGTQKELESFLLQRARQLSRPGSQENLPTCDSLADGELLRPVGAFPAQRIEYYRIKKTVLCR